MVAAACTGFRSAGLVAAVAAGAAFDFFLTAPYLTLVITDPADIETAVMLLVVGVAITEVLQWGRRAQRQVRDRDAYLSALLAISDRDQADDHQWIDAVGAHLVGLLHLDRCAWADTTDPGEPRLEADGEVRHGGRLLRVDDDGLPVDSTVTVPVHLDDPGSPGVRADRGRRRRPTDPAATPPGPCSRRPDRVGSAAGSDGVTDQHPATERHPARTGHAGRPRGRLR